MSRRAASVSSPVHRYAPPDDLGAAEKLINNCGYHRRDQELADAKLAILGDVT